MSPCTICRIMGGNAVRLTSGEVPGPDDKTATAPIRLSGGTLIISVNLLIPAIGPQRDPSNQCYEIPIAATNQDRQVNLLTRSYLARLNVTDGSNEDDDVEEFERRDDECMFPCAVEETCTG